MGKYVPSLSYRRSSQQILALNFLIFATFISLIFCSKFNYFLSGSVYEHEITTTQDVINAKHKVGYLLYKEVLEFFRNEPKMIQYIEAGNSRRCNLSNSCLRLTATKKDMITLTNSFTANYWARHFLDSDGRVNYRKTSIFSGLAQTKYYFTHGFPPYEKIDRYLQYCQSYGFVNYILKQYDTNTRVLKETLAVQVLTLNDVMTGFLIWSIGLLVSTIVFCLEAKFFF